jgi:DNA modification methylase
MSDPEFDVQHRDCFDSLAAMRDAGGADLILTSPPYPDARSDEAYGASFDTSLGGYARLGDATFEALKPGGVCALNIDGPVRVWRPELGESERSLVAFEVAIDWAKRVGFRYLEHCAKLSANRPGKFGPRWRHGWEPVHVFCRPCGAPHFDHRAYMEPAKSAGMPKKNQSTQVDGVLGATDRFIQPDERTLTTAVYGARDKGNSDKDHPAPFTTEFADAFVRCYGPPGGIIGDPFVGSGTVAFAVHRAGEGRRFIGGDLGIRQTILLHGRRVPCGRRWADIVNDGLRQTRLF